MVQVDQPVALVHARSALKHPLDLGDEVVERAARIQLALLFRLPRRDARFRLQELVVVVEHVLRRRGRRWLADLALSVPGGGLGVGGEGHCAGIVRAAGEPPAEAE